MTLNRLRKLFRLSPADRVILAQAWVLLLLADLALRFLAFKRFLALSRTLALNGRDEPAVARPSSGARLAWLVEVAGRYSPINATCLKKAIVLSWLLERRGIATTLRIGVARRDGALIAHAWLEQGGEVLLGHPGSDEYERLVLAVQPDG